jgi:hypothetical protein
MRCGVSGLCVCVLWCGVRDSDEFGVSGWYVCCGVFVPDYDEVCSVFFVCLYVVVCLFLIMMRC